MSLELSWLKGKDTKKQYKAKEIPRRKKKKSTNQQILVSSPKPGVQTPQKIPGSIKMTSFVGRCARFKEETYWKHQIV